MHKPELHAAVQTLILAAEAILQRIEADAAGRVEPPRAEDPGAKAALSGLAAAFTQAGEHFEYLAERGVTLPPPRHRSAGR
jgi:hypothetical protein